MPKQPRSSPLSLAALLDEAAGRRARGDLRGAEQAYRQAVLADPTSVAALNALGNLAAAAQRYDQAIDFHRRAVKAGGSDPGLLNDLANVLIQAGDPEAALVHLRKAERRSPHLGPILLNRARAHRALNEPAKALAILDRLTAPEWRTDVALERAVTLTQIGRAAEAVPLFRSVLRARPTDVRAIDGLATAHRATEADNDLAVVEAALAAPQLPRLARASAHRAAGKILEDLGRVDAAFAHFTAANQAASAPFDIAGHEAFVDASIARLTAPLIAERAKWGVASELPVFIVGLPRSGTTLIEQILSSHPHVAGLGEIAFVEDTLRGGFGATLTDAALVERMADGTSDTIGREAQRYLDLVTRRAGTATRSVDKMPHNFLVLGWIAMLLPRARVIHCARDPLDVCLSCFTQHFAYAHAYTTDLALLGRYHRAYVRLMRHWRGVLGPRLLEVRYEDVVADLEGSARRLIAHLDLAWDARCLAFHRTERVVTTPSRWQVRQPLYASSVGRWRRFERHLGPLMDALAGKPGKQE